MSDPVHRWKIPRIGVNIVQHGKRVELCEQEMAIVAGGQFLNSWNWDAQAPGSGIYRLSQDELDRR